MKLSMLQCDKCDKTFKVENKLSEHRQLHHEPGEFVCAVCNKLYSLRSKFIIHYRFCHKPYKYSCDICKKLFPEKRKLKEHEDTHLGKAGRLFECDFCGRKYKTKRYIKEHIERQHLKTEGAEIRLIAEQLKRALKSKDVIPCNECPKTFSSKFALTYHKKRVHSDVKKQYCCTQCGKLYAFEHDLSLHINNYHCHRICDICGAKLTANRYKSHMRSHSGERNHRCFTCPAAFTRKDLLNKHLFTHSQIKPFNCGICFRGFYDRSRYKNHLLRNHTNST